MSLPEKARKLIESGQVYSVFTDGYVPKGPWYNFDKLMSYKAAAAYAAKIIENERPKYPPTIQVWEGGWLAAERISQKRTQSSSYEDIGEPAREHIYIATAMANAIKKKYPEDDEGQA